MTEIKELAPPKVYLSKLEVLAIIKEAVYSNRSGDDMRDVLDFLAEWIKRLRSDQMLTEEELATWNSLAKHMEWK